jgi:hypothetical protein
VSPEGVTTDSVKLEAVKNWPPPTDKHQLRSFLRLCTYNRRFIRGFADIGTPLARLTEEKLMFEWSSEAEDAFRSLKGALCTASVLGHLLRDEKITVGTDVSNTEIGGLMSQVQDGHELVLACFSKTLSEAEGNYCMARGELLAIVKLLEHFHKYLHPEEFHLRTDHAALSGY